MTFEVNWTLLRPLIFKQQFEELIFGSLTLNQVARCYTHISYSFSLDLCESRDPTIWIILLRLVLNSVCDVSFRCTKSHFIFCHRYDIKVHCNDLWLFTNLIFLQLSEKFNQVLLFKQFSCLWSRKLGFIISVIIHRVSRSCSWK